MKEKELENEDHQSKRKAEYIKALMAESYKMGMMAMVKIYEPTADMLRLRELAPWCRINGIPKSSVDALISTGKVDVQTLGEGKNSPKYISKEQLMNAILACKLEVGMGKYWAMAL